VWRNNNNALNSAAFCGARFLPQNEPGCREMSALEHSKNAGSAAL
jgi:hypothetical protein